MSTTPESKFIQHVPCEVCGSSDGASLYDDGHIFCFAHGGLVQKADNDEMTDPLRGISPSTYQHYDVGITDNEYLFNYPALQNPAQAGPTKVRKRGESKSFYWSGSGKPSDAGLFGQGLFPAGCAKSITITEGEFDALASYEMQGSKYPVVSIKNGAAGASRDVSACFEYLDSFPTVVINFDNDEPGRAAAQSVASMFGLGKVRILTLKDAKDANDYIKQGKTSQYYKEWWAAPTYVPGGLKLGSSMWEEIVAPKNYETVDYPWQGMNDKTYGIRLSEFVVVNAPTGVGKTTLLKEIEHYVKKNSSHGIGLIHLEEPNSDTALGLMSISANKPLHLPDVRQSVEEGELRDYYNDIINDDRIVIWDHFGSNSVDAVVSKIRHMHNLGCKYIILDHLSILVSDQHGDERKELDEIATKLKTLTVELNIAIIAVIHQNRNGDIRGTAGVEQLANIVLKLKRNVEGGSNVTEIIVQKNRFCGRTGPACWLVFNKDTNRMREMTEAEVQRFKEEGKDPEVWS